MCSPLTSTRQFCPGAYRFKPSSTRRSRRGHELRHDLAEKDLCLGVLVDLVPFGDRIDEIALGALREPIPRVPRLGLASVEVICVPLAVDVGHGHGSTSIRPQGWGHPSLTCLMGFMNLGLLIRSVILESSLAARRFCSAGRLTCHGTGRCSASMPSCSCGSGDEPGQSPCSEDDQACFPVSAQDETMAPLGDRARGRSIQGPSYGRDEEPVRNRGLSIRP